MPIARQQVGRALQSSEDWLVQGKAAKSDGPVPVKKKRKVQPEAMQPGPKPVPAVSRPDASLPHTQQAQPSAPPAAGLSLAALAAAAGQASCSHSTLRFWNTHKY